jgi:hypothetical protein
MQINPTVYLLNRKVFRASVPVDGTTKEVFVISTRDLRVATQVKGERFADRVHIDHSNGARWLWLTLSRSPKRRWAQECPSSSRTVRGSSLKSSKVAGDAAAYLTGAWNGTLAEFGERVLVPCTTEVVIQSGEGRARPP